MNKENWLQDPNEWQFIDPTNDFIFPWMTIDFLEYLTTLDISRWRIFESGTGCGTLWWAAKCEEVVTLDSNKNWFNRTRQFAKEKELNNVNFNLVSLQNADDYLRVLIEQSRKFHAIVVDGIFRNQFALLAEAYIKTGGLLIYDNYRQEGFGSFDVVDKAFDKYPMIVYKQSPILSPESHSWVWNGNSEHFSKLRQGHPDWKTACWKMHE